MAHPFRSRTTSSAQAGAPIVLPRPPACPAVAVPGSTHPARGPHAHRSLDGLCGTRLHSFQIAERVFRNVEISARVDAAGRGFTAGRDGSAYPNSRIRSAPWLE